MCVYSHFAGQSVGRSFSGSDASIVVLAVLFALALVVIICVALIVPTSIVALDVVSRVRQKHAFFSLVT